MKNILSLTILAGLLGTGALHADQDIYITGSTAFRANVYNSVKALYGANLTSENAGSASISSGNNAWTMSGTISGLGGVTTIHAGFNGSVQGVYGVYNPTFKQAFLKLATLGDTTMVTNSATCAFSDVDSTSTAYPLNPSSFTERYVAVQPFVYVRSFNAPTTVSNITYQTLQTMLPNGRLPLSMLTGSATDSNTVVYVVNRSLDSGTRVTAYADCAVGGTPTVYYWNPASSTYTVATTNMGPALFGPGYVGGGDVKNTLNINNGGNIAFGYLGLSDAKGVNGGLNIMPYNGMYPSSDIKGGSSVPAVPAFDNVINGQYSYWAYEVLSQPNTLTAGDQNINGTDLTTFCRLLSGYDSSENFVGGVGSIDYDISTNTVNRVAIRLGDMNVKRDSVGGFIYPK